MNDITALMATMKAAAEKAITEEGIAWWDERLLMAEQGPILHEADAKFIAATNPAKVLALVEALEKAQRRIADLEGSLGALEEVYISAADEVSELESRTVTVKLPPRVDSSNVPFTAHTWNCCLDAVEKCLAAAGIQVIEGEA